MIYLELPLFPHNPGKSGVFFQSYMRYDNTRPQARGAAHVDPDICIKDAPLGAHPYVRS